MYAIVKDGSNFIIVNFESLIGVENDTFRFSGYISADPSTKRYVSEPKRFARVHIDKFVFTYEDAVKYIESEWEKASYNTRHTDVKCGEIVLTIKSKDTLIRTIDNRFLWITGYNRGSYLDNPSSYMYKVVG
jgi:hypothetical protein